MVIAFEATAVLYARSFVTAINQIPAGNISDMPLDPTSLDLEPASFIRTGFWSLFDPAAKGFS